MKTMLIAAMIFASSSLLGQKMTSYRYEKEHEGYFTVKGHQFYGIISDAKMITSTTFIFDSVARTIKIGSKVWTIVDGNKYNYSLVTNEKSCEVHLLPKVASNKDEESQILVKYDDGTDYRYYFKDSEWKFPVF